MKGLLSKGDHFGQKKISILTKKERELLQLIAEGFSNKDIATHINRSTNTIHVQDSLVLPYGKKPYTTKGRKQTYGYNTFKHHKGSVRRVRVFRERAGTFYKKRSA